MSKIFKAMAQKYAEKEGPVRMTSARGPKWGAWIWPFLNHLIPVALAVSAALWIFSIPVMRMAKQFDKQKQDVAQLKQNMATLKGTLETDIAMMEKTIKEVQDYTSTDSDQLNARLRKLAGDIYLLDGKVQDQTQKSEKQSFENEKALEELELTNKLLQNKLEAISKELETLKNTPVATEEATEDSTPKIDVQIEPVLP